MLQNYIKIALRNLWRQKGYSFINIGGLAVGMACCMLIMLFVHDELNQLLFMQHQHLGFDIEQVVVVNATGIPDQQMEKQYATVKQEFRQHPSVEAVSASNTLPGRDAWVGMVRSIAIAIALLTVSTQSFKAAMMNPVKSLRSE